MIEIKVLQKSDPGDSYLGFLPNEYTTECTFKSDEEATATSIINMIYRALILEDYLPATIFKAMLDVIDDRYTDDEPLPVNDISIFKERSYDE